MPARYDNDSGLYMSMDQSGDIHRHLQMEQQAMESKVAVAQSPNWMKIQDRGVTSEHLKS